MTLSKKNLFTTEEYNALRVAVLEQYEDKPKDHVHITELLQTGWENKLKIEKDVGKATLEIRPLPKIILDKVISYLESIGHFVTEEQIVAIYQRYSLEYGQPSLAPHIDFKAGGISLDYLLNTNIDWPVIVEGESFSLEVNEAISFDASAVVHWRPKMELKKEDFVEIIIFHILTPNKEILSQLEKDERVKPYLEMY